MQPAIYTRNIKLTQRLEDHVARKTDRLDRYLPNLAEVRVDLSQQNAKNSAERQIAQLTVRDARGTILRAEEANGDIFAAVDMVVDKMYRQIKKYRGKMRRGRRLAASTAQELDMLNMMESVPVEDDSAEIDGEITRVKKFAMQPMSAEEAVDQLDLLGHDFFMFFNADENQFNVLYRRNDSSFGLLQPDLN